MKVLISRVSGNDVENKDIPLTRVYPLNDDCLDKHCLRKMYSANIERLEELNILANMTQGGIIYSRISGYGKLNFPDFDYEAEIYDDWIE